MQWDKGNSTSEIDMKTMIPSSLTFFMGWDEESSTSEVIMKTTTTSSLTS